MRESIATATWPSRRLAAMIQQDIGANPEDPHGDAHGTFSFDISNGTCGVLTALQIVDGFLKSHTIDVRAGGGQRCRSRTRNERALSVLARRCSPVVRLDRRRLRPRAHSLGQLLPDDGESFNATVGLVDGRNVLRFAVSEAIDELFAAAAAQAVDACLRESALTLDDIDAIVAAPAHERVPLRACRASRVAREQDHRRRRPGNAHRLIGGGIRPRS